MSDAQDKSSFLMEVLDGFKDEINDNLKDYLHMDDADMFVVDIVTAEIKDYNDTIR